jgi:Protein kinase domain/Putative zinc-finger
MSCPTEDAIARFVDGTLSSDARDDMVAHIAQCAECRALVSELARGLAVPPIPSSAPTPPTFRTGELVAERYRVLRFLAEGGMGEVYEADDLELRSRVALKTVRHKIAAHPKMLARFKREIYFARKVTHPNVCRIFDMGFHVAGGARVAFLTMEFLEGETLADRIERGRMSSAEATPLALQMIAGLSAAHGEHVVHRDFKSSASRAARPRTGSGRQRRMNKGSWAARRTWRQSR